ncbi:Hsp20/alpha crystallin family protein [Hoeflea sp. TYP-13]|uniref:Hsp20/alpha crystallin family protein n=1 Tax=Hoeflea sp. TYP-13 TaxID=3230023 RepID=UPI0034C5C8CC
MVEKSHTAGWMPNIYDPLRNLGQRVADWFAPRSDASAMEDCYEINIELPGVKAEDVDVAVDGNSLTVRGEKRSQREETGRTFFFSEREYGSFQRTFRLPPDADNAKIEADYSDGLLKLKIAKVKSAKPEERKISIRKS